MSNHPSISWPDRARVEVECRAGRGSPSSGDALHEREPHVLRRLPMPLPLVDEPVVDLLRVQARHRGEPHLVLFRGVRPAVVCVPPVHESKPSILGQLPFLPLLQELGPEAAEAAAVLLEQHLLELVVSQPGAVLLHAGVGSVDVPRARLVLRRPHHFILHY